MADFDIIVLGLGAMGSAALYQSAKRGARVLGIDRYKPPHVMGSTHGDTRVTRVAVGEGLQYVPLARRSHEIWKEIENETGKSLLTQNGVLIVSPGEDAQSAHKGQFFQTTLDAADRFGIPYEKLDNKALRKAYPQFAFRKEDVGYFEPGGGFVRPEACIEAQLALAAKKGANIRTNETVVDFQAHANGDVSVTTNRGTYRAYSLIVAAGAWLPDLLQKKLGRHFTIYRQVLYWFDPGRNRSSFTPKKFPTFIWNLGGAGEVIYGFPAIDGNGVKIATEQYTVSTTPQAASRNVRKAESAAMYRGLIGPNFPGLTNPEPVKTATCLYTVTPDSHFVIDRHPDMKRVIIASPCSGHGFKHSAAIGELLAQFADTDLAPFSFNRFY